MQEIIKEFKVALSGEDIFLAWQNELHLRRKMRTMADSEMVLIEDHDEFQFVQRCLYYGPKQDVFFEILYRNTSNLTILDCIMQAPPDLLSGFLGFLAHNIVVHKPPARNLQFLINMYREELRADFVEIINHMDTELCSYLLARTSNIDLRDLLKSRKLYPAQEEVLKHYGLIDTHEPPNKYPTLYGDKIQIIAAAANALKSCQNLDLSKTPLSPESIDALLDSADMLFRAGLLADCLAILTKMVNCPGRNEQSLLLSNAEPYCQRLNGLLGKVLPIYSLLANPSAPHHYALELYRSLFPGFFPDPASLLYLDIHAIVMASLQGHHQYARYELAQKADKILSFRPDDSVASSLFKSVNNMTQEDWSGLERTIKQRIPYHPHEVYVTMEVLRLWHREGGITFNRITATNLLNHYLQFFAWIPASPFMNEQVQNQLGRLAAEESRSAGERILKIIQETSPNDLVAQKMPEGKLLDSEDYRLQQQLLLSKFMGVF